MTHDVTTSANDIRCALKLRFPKESHALMFEVAPSPGGGTYGGTRYADAVAVGLWASHGHLIQGIEIKVSRSDFLHEMKTPEKSEPIMRYCGRWWLACPSGMVKREELPPTWGMLELNSAGVLIARVKAPILQPQPVNLKFFASLCRRRAGMDEEMTTAFISKAVQEQVAPIEKRLRDKHADSLGYQQRKIVDAEAALNRIKEKTGIDLAEYGIENDIIAAIVAYRKVQKTGGWNSNFSSLRESLERAVAAFDAAGIEKAAP